MTSASSAASDRLDSLPADRRALFLKLKAERAGAPAKHPPVPLRSGPGPVRLVLLHASGGALYCYTPLVRALRPEIDVIGFAAEPTDSDLPASQRMTTVASRLLAALAKVADPGRCLLGGWSHGGVLAFEMARQQAESGQAPPHLLLMDCCYTGDRPLEDEPEIRRRFAYDIIRQAGLDEPAVLAAIETADPDRDGLRATLAAAGIDLTLTDAELADRYEIFRGCSQALQMYRPVAPYGGNVTLLVTELADVIERRWAAMVTGRMRRVRLPGDHFTLFRPPALATVVSEIEAAAGLATTQGVS